MNISIVKVTQRHIREFSRAMRVSLQDNANSKLRRAYMRLMLKEIVVEEKEIRICGSKNVLAQQLEAEKPVPPSMVSTFMEGWRTRQDSNLRPLPSEGSALSS